MKKITQVIVALTLVVNVAAAQSKKATPGPLDKKTYSVEILEENKKKAEPVKDDLKFASGKFQCKMLMEEGYKATPYEGTPDSTVSPITISFSAESTGEKETSFKWEGTVTGDDIEGTAATYKKGKVKKSYTFTGSLKGKKKPKE